jgi:hypothetical protein
MDIFDLELIRKGHPIQMRDGRPLTLIEITDTNIYCSSNGDNESAWLLDGHWQRIPYTNKWNGVECCADIILKGNFDIQLTLF